MIHYFLIWIVIFLAVEIFGLLVIWIYDESKGFCISEYTVATGKELHRDINVVMISDLHNTDVGNKNEDVLAAIDKIKPDFILLAGDMITSYMQPKYNSENAFDFLKKLAEKYSVYYHIGADRFAADQLSPP